MLECVSILPLLLPQRPSPRNLAVLQSTPDVVRLLRHMPVAGWSHTVLLRSDGTAIACGSNKYQQCDLPALPNGLVYMQAAAGMGHTVLLRSDGKAVACGLNTSLQCNLPPLDDGLTYTQIAAGRAHTVLLRSDGIAVACGTKLWPTGSSTPGQSWQHLPVLANGLTYTQVAASWDNTVLLRSDGTVVACGSGDCGQCIIHLCFTLSLN